MVAVVQLVRASDCGSECRGFESHLPPNRESNFKRGLTLFFIPALRNPLHHSTNSKSNIIITQLQHFKHPRRPMRMSASVDADVCAGRCGCLRRSMRMSAPVDADVCVGRRGWFVEATRTEAHIVPDHETTSAYTLIILYSLQ